MLNTISVRLSPATVHALEEISAATERTKTFLVRKALENYLAEYADYQIALDRLRNKDDKIISSHNMRKNLGIHR